MESLLRLVGQLLIIAAIAATSACAYRAPTIAHIHLGHTITAVEGTPNNVGFLIAAQQSAAKALEHANLSMAEDQSVESIREHVAAVNRITNEDGELALVQTLDQAMDHIRFAGESDDASETLREGANDLEPLTEGIFYRSNLIKLYSQDIGTSDLPEDARLIAEQVQQLTFANVNGEDLDNDGNIGNEPREAGMLQVKQAIDALVARENPPYVTVDRWYLFNLIRLPNGRWIFRPAGSNQARGY